VIALVSARAAEHLDSDLPLLLEHLDGVEVVHWDAPQVDWSRFSAVVIRSTWDYHQRLPEFLDWADRVARLTRLVNPVELVRWNVDKGYLVDLAERGVPVVPTRVVADVDDVATLRGNGGFDGRVVVKPAIGAGSNGAARHVDDPDGAEHHALSLLSGGRVVVQPYVDGVDDRGETGLVILGGQFSHAFRKGAILSADRAWADDLYVVEDISARQATEEELAVGRHVADLFPEAAYLRVDLLPGGDGPLVSEVEAIEPSLFLHVAEGAAERAARAFASLGETRDGGRR
jgi:glutathione synthase/RimK-type ligase-like ATP-grasp enzyme